MKNVETLKQIQLNKKKIDYEEKINKFKHLQDFKMKEI